MLPENGPMDALDIKRTGLCDADVDRRLSHHRQGVRLVLLALSHHDNPADNRWWPSFAESCAGHHIPVLFDADLAVGSSVVGRFATLQRDFIRKFTFKHLVGDHVLTLAWSPAPMPAFGVGVAGGTAFLHLISLRLLRNIGQLL